MEDYPDGTVKNNSGLIIPEGTILTDTLLRIFNYNKLSQLYSESAEKDAVSLITALFNKMNLFIDIPQEDLANIPEEGPFITVSNHPYRGVDSMILMKLISKKRKDFKILASHTLKTIDPFDKVIIPVNTSESAGKANSSIPGIREALAYLSAGHGIGIFPTAEDSGQWESPRIILDPEWNPAALKLIKLPQVPVVPVYFHGTRTRISQVISLLNPLQQNTALPEELVNKKKRIVRVRIGAPVTVKEQAEFSNVLKLGRYLRARVYSLGSTIENKKQSKFLGSGKKVVVEPVIDPVDPALLREEFEYVRTSHELFTIKNYTAICAPVESIPNIFREIGRLREVTFREVGEGTNKSIDIDEYDFYYYHLFIWDTDENRLVGAYRLGKGREIIDTYGIKGFYINSLFGIKKKLIPVLRESIELGRSFITRDYQRKPIPLFLLWKGIMIFLLRHAEYRYLIGPVSISNDLSRFSKTLIVDFIRTYFFNDALAKYIKPRKDFVLKPDKVVDRNVFIDLSEKDINKIEKVIIDIEPGYKIPVLLKKYLEINGRIIGFNIDPAFNNCLDGLLILDLNATPEEFIRALSKEMNDPRILERFGK
ncbi:MAG: lysophospholipid acyltransferase family protein [Bacteroidales bacterium]